MAGEGIDFYQDYVNGKLTPAADPKLLDTLNAFAKYLSYIKRTTRFHEEPHSKCLIVSMRSHVALGLRC
jgi:hypothetical protein